MKSNTHILFRKLAVLLKSNSLVPSPSIFKPKPVRNNKREVVREMAAVKRQIAVKSFNNLFSVHIIPVLQNNFCYVVQCTATKACGIVDVSEVDPIVSHLRTINDTTSAILTTHKHWDHSDGNMKMAETFPGMKVYGGSKDNVPGCTNKLEHGDMFQVGSLNVTVSHTPCHTTGHVLYHVTHPTDPENGALFTGDTLFVGGIGAFFEGNASQMCRAMEIVAQMPHQTCVYPGHEYTCNFLKFSKSIDTKSEFVASQLAKYEALVEQGLPSVPSTIAEEMKQNLFMRVFEEDLQNQLNLKDPVVLMQHLYDNCP